MKDIRWLANRLRSMSIPEVAWRVQQKLLQKIEYNRIYSAHLPVTAIPLPRELQILTPNIERIHLNPDNQVFELFENLVLFGQYDYQTYKKDWNAGFQTDNQWPTAPFSYEIPISQREDIGDIRTNWELNRHFQFVGLAKNFYVTGNREYLEELSELFEDWNNQNLFLHGVQWSSAMEVGIRIVSWVYMYCFLEMAFRRNPTGREEELLNAIQHGIKVMAQYVLRHRARYSSANNHLIVEMLGVGIAGVFLNYPKWTHYAKKVLTEELPKQNYKDGVNKEMSLHYQCFVMEAYAIFWLLLKKNSQKIPETWEQFLVPMSKFVADCCGAYGEVVVFGDCDEGKILDFSGSVKDYYRYTLQLMGILLDSRYTDTPLIENLFWLTDAEETEAYQKKPLYQPDVVCSYKEGGYTMLRSTDGKVLIGFDHAELGFGKIAAHGHADALSFQMYIDGQPIFVDSGTYSYHVTPVDRKQFRSTAAHNTVMIEDHEQSEMLGPFLWGKKAKSNLLEIQDGKLGMVSRYEKGSHMREIELSDQLLCISDEIGDHSGVAYYHIHPQGVLMQIADNVVSISYKDAQVTLRVENGQFDRIDSEYSERYGDKQHNACIKCSFNKHIKIYIEWKHIENDTSF